MRRPRYSFAFVPLVLLAPLAAHSQGPSGPPAGFSPGRPPYSNSSDGLRWQLQDALNAARAGNGANLESLIKQTEIPVEREWFVHTFGKEKGEAWSADYESNLGENESTLADQFKRLAAEDGEFRIRCVNDEPASARKVEAGIIDALQRSVNIYFASWKKRESPPGSNSLPIGYFVFLDGRFRLDGAVNVRDLASAPDPVTVDAGTIASPTVEARNAPATPSANSPYAGVAHPGNNGVGYPSCAYCPDPPYTKLARKNRLAGTVILQAIIQPTGEISDLQVVKSPDPELEQMALEGVAKWRMNPARLANGEAVPVVVPIEITFRLAK